MPPRPWTADFDFYITLAKERPIAVLLDMNAVEHAPLESHPLRLTVRVRMKEPRPDGLRSEQESRALMALEDRLIVMVEGVSDAIYVGRNVVGGYTYLVFYAGERPEVAFPRLASVVAETGGDYAVGLTRERDEAWTFYRETLYPEADQHQVMGNRRLLDNFAKAGDDGKTARLVDHAALFPTPAQAVQAAAALRALGYATDEPAAAGPDETEGGPMTTRLAFHRVDALAGGLIDEATLAILDLVTNHGGDYDGWGAPIAPGQAPGQRPGQGSDPPT